jgi:5-methylcytosine-specific restriction endonuclease McrA
VQVTLAIPQIHHLLSALTTHAQTAAPMSRWSADSRWYRKAKAEFLAANRTCWICGHPIDPDRDQIDHVLAASQYPHLRYDPANWRPAHGWRKCPTCGIACNQSRGIKPPKRSPRSRRW